MSKLTPTNQDACPFLVMCHVLARTSLPEFVGPVGLAKLEITARLSLSIFQPGLIWWRCLSADFPRLATDPSCYELPQRRDLMHCYGPLRRAYLAEGTYPIIRNSTEAKRLARRLQDMEKSSAKHKTLGGRVTCILVGHFEMHYWEGDVKLRGLATEFLLPCELHAAMGRSSNVTALPIHLGLAPNWYRPDFANTG